MANYKLTTATPTGLTSFLAFTASATDTIITSVVASDNATSTLEALIQKVGGSIIEVAHAVVQADKPEELLTAPLALEAGDKLYVRTTKAGAKFVISYVEETTIPNDTALGGLADVDTAGVSDGDSLVYSSSAGRWEPAVVSGGGGGGGASELDDLTDVVVTGASSGDVLRHDGSDFVNVNLNTYIDGRLATIDADDIDDASTINRFVTAQMQDNLGFLAPVTGNIDLDQHDLDIAANTLKQGYTTALFDADLANSNTGDLAEGSNLYYTEARVSANTDVVTNTAKRSYPTGDETKLAGIATGATANDTDANLLNRANHSGSQLSSTISDFTAETESIIDDVMGSTTDLSEGTNLYYTDARVDARIGVAKIEDLDEVSSVAPSTGQVLKWSGTEWAPAADNSSTGGAGGVVDSVNGISQAAVVLDADDIDDTSTTHRFVTAQDQTNLGQLSAVTTSIDLDQHDADIAANTLKQGYTTALFDADLANSDTGDVAEGTNLYYTEARVSANTDVTANTLKRSYPSGDETKLAGIATGATANDTDANLLNRGNHSGQQLASTISDFGSQSTSVAVAVIAASDLQDIGNVDTPTTGEFLKWNGSTWETDTVGGGAVDSVNSQTGAVVLDTDDIAEGTTNKYATSAQLAKVDHISVSQSVDLDTIESDVSTNSLKNSYPSADETKLSGIATGATANDTDANLLNRANHSGQQLASTISDMGSAVGTIVASTNLQSLNNVDTPTTGEYLKWNGSTWETDAVTGGSGGVVDSVNGISQAAVVLDADDIDDTSTTHKFVAAADVTKLGLITVANAVDLDSVSALATFSATTANTALSSITSHENSLRNHLDVTYSQTNPANIPTGSFLQWQGTAWEDGEVDLQDLANVDVPTTGEYLKWNGTTWETDTVSGGGGGGTTIMDADTALSAAGDYEAGARLMKLVNTNTTLTAGKVYQLLANGWDVSTNASEAGSSGMMAVCSSDSSTGSAMIMEGIFRTRIILSSAAIGDPLYLSVGSEFTLTAPTSAATVRKMGYVVDPSNNMAYFSPDETTITIQ